MSDRHFNAQTVVSHGSAQTIQMFEVNMKVPVSTEHRQESRKINLVDNDKRRRDIVAEEEKIVILDDDGSPEPINCKPHT
jgi:hypothetical protein